LNENDDRNFVAAPIGGADPIGAPKLRSALKLEREVSFSSIGAEKHAHASSLALLSAASRSIASGA